MKVLSMQYIFEKYIVYEMIPFIWKIAILILQPKNVRCL